MYASPLQQRRGAELTQPSPEVAEGQAQKWSWLEEASRSPSLQGGRGTFSASRRTTTKTRKLIALGATVAVCLTLGWMVYAWRHVGRLAAREEAAAAVGAPGHEDHAAAAGLGGVRPDRLHGRLGVDAAGRRLWSTLPAPQNLDVTAELRRGGCFNIRLSDSLPLDRASVDNRAARCKSISYNVSALPEATVIIVFHNEPFSTLMRSVHSVLNLSPPRLLREILLIDDGSTSPHLVRPSEDVPSQLEAYIEALPKTRLIRNPYRTGIVGARLLGIENSAANIFIVLDSHIEVQPGWLEPLVSRIHADRTVVVMPQIDGIEASTFEYQPAGIGCTLGMIWLLMEHAFTPNNRYPARARQDATSVYVESPTMAGGLFAANKDFFLTIGGYDRGMTYWGVENIELSFRLWLCGGKLECSKCSRVYHIFRSGGHAYEIPDPHSLTRNKLRTMAVWMDEYADLAWRRLGKPSGIDAGDIQPRLELKKRLGCKPFRYFLNEVWPESDVRDLKRDVPFLGHLRHNATGLCLLYGSDDPGGSTHLGTCRLPGWMYFRRSGFIMPVTNDEACLNTQGQLQWCRETGMDQARWRVTPTGQIVLESDGTAYARYADEGMTLPHRKWKRNVCLTGDPAAHKVQGRPCTDGDDQGGGLRGPPNNGDTQIWDWEAYNPPATWEIPKPRA